MAYLHFFDSIRRKILVSKQKSTRRLVQKVCGKAVPGTGVAPKECYWTVFLNTA
jgi:hypothetical protein